MSDELSAEARALIRGGVAQESPVEPSRRARMKRSLLINALLVAPRTVEAAQVAASGGSLSSEMALSKLAIWAAKGAGAGMLVAVTTYGVTEVAPRAMTPVPVPTVAPHLPDVANQQGHGAKAAEGDEPPRAVDTAASPPATAEPASSQRVAPASASALPAASSTASRSLSAELLLMAEVQRALRDGHAARALELVSRHAAEFPDGQLVNERLAAEAFAACQRGEIARARRAAARFLERDPASSLASRVKRTCPPDGR
ncbi:MAG TPA: hypothetical protein VFZ53_31255 [Polyangiaceae bacterium]